MYVVSIITEAVLAELLPITKSMPAHYLSGRPLKRGLAGLGADDTCVLFGAPIAIHMQKADRPEMCILRTIVVMGDRIYMFAVHASVLFSCVYIFFCTIQNGSVS